MDKYVTGTNHRLRNYCKQSDIVYIDNANKIEVHLGVKKAAPKSEGNSCFAKYLLKHLSNAWLCSDATRRKSKNCKKVQLIFK